MPTKQFQLDAVASVTELFDGQPRGAPEYAVINLGEMGGLFAGQDQTELGVGNRLLVARTSWGKPACDPGPQRHRSGRPGRRARGVGVIRRPG